MEHASDERLTQLLDSGRPDAGDHVETCPACRSRLDAAREALAWASEAQVPEPSPLYWTAFRAQVSRRIDSERARRRRFGLWSGLAAAAGLAGAVAFLARGPEPSPAALAVLPAWSALPSAEDDAGLAVLEALAPVSLELAECRGLDDCLGDLSEAESLELAEALRQEMGRDL